MVRSRATAIILFEGDDLRDGRLQAPLGFIPDGSEYVLLSPSGFQSDERLMVFLQWVKAEMQKSYELVMQSIPQTARRSPAG